MLGEITFRLRDRPLFHLKSIEALNQAVEFGYGNDAAVQANLASLHFESGAMRHAVDHFVLLISQFPDDAADGFLPLANAACIQGHLTRHCISAYKKAAAGSVGETAARLNIYRAILHRYQQQTKTAIAIIEAAAKSARNRSTRETALSLADFWRS